MAADDEGFPLFGVIGDRIRKGFGALSDDAMSGVVNDGDIAVGNILPVDPGRLGRDQAVVQSKNR